MRNALSCSAAASAPNKWVVLLTVVLMTFMSTLDSSIVNVALPAMQRELAVGASDIQWVSSVYLLVCCAEVLVFGRLGDLFGKVRLFQLGVALFAVFVAVEKRAASPLVRLDVFRNGLFSLNLVTMFLCFAEVGGTELLLPFYLQDACGMPSNVAGLALTAIPLAMAVAGPVAGALSDRIGCALPCLVGLAVYAAGIALVGGLTQTASLALVVGLMAFMAAGTGLFQSPNNSLVMGSVDREHLGFAGSLVSLVRYMGMSAGVTGGTTLLYGRMSALAGYEVSAYVPGQPELFLAGFSFAFYVFAALVLAGAVFTAAGMVLKRRRR